MLAQLLDGVAARHERFLLIDVHSYNHRRDGPDAPPMPQEKAPDINIGTFSMPRERWSFLVDPLTDAMRSFDFNGRRLDVRENVAFQGKGEQTRFVHDLYPGSGCAIALEIKKFYMDEWTGAPDPSELAAMRALVAHIARTAEADIVAMKSAAIRSVPRAFAPEFGPRGELRQTIGESGRAHLDRWLPFLVLHRSDDPTNSIARRVAVNSPGYLIWSPEEDEEAAAALRAIAAALRDRLGPVLLISVEDAPWREQPEDAPELPPFVVRVGMGRGGEAALRALDALAEACGEVEVDLRRATVDAAAEPVLSDAAGGVEGAGDADRLRMTIPPIHRAPDGRPYPRLTHELALALGDALLRAAAAFMEGGPAAPLHYRALGRSAFLAAALHADKKLDAIARSYDFLLSLTPINAAEAMHLFLEGRADRAPQFRYRPLTVDPDIAKRDLYQIDLALLEDPRSSGCSARNGASSTTS